MKWIGSFYVPPKYQTPLYLVQLKLSTKLIVKCKIVKLTRTFIAAKKKTSTKGNVEIGFNEQRIVHFLTSAKHDFSMNCGQTYHQIHSHWIISYSKAVSLSSSLYLRGSNHLEYCSRFLSLMDDPLIQLDETERTHSIHISVWMLFSIRITEKFFQSMNSIELELVEKIKEVHSKSNHFLTFVLLNFCSIRKLGHWNSNSTTNTD